MEIRIKIFDDEKDFEKVLGLVKALRYPMSHDKKVSEFKEIIKDVELLTTAKDLGEIMDKELLQKGVRR